MPTIDRRALLELTALASARVTGSVFSSGLAGVARAGDRARDDDFLFVQLSDTHCVVGCDVFCASHHEAMAGELVVE